MHDKIKSGTRRQIPAVNTLLESIGETDLPRPFIVDIVRRELKVERSRSKVSAPALMLQRIQDRIGALRRSRLQTVINGTGIVIHTNLGRAPLASEAAEMLREIASSYANLEQDLATGTRGPRAGYVEQALSLLCRSEAATVVNNCAAALLLIVHHFTKQKPEIVISRGEMVQIGGGFRIGEILESAGARLREVGATNKTTIADYAKAIGPQAGFILKVHRSNFFMSGFVASPVPADLAALARKKRIPFIQDLGSGAMFDTRKEGLEEHEPTPAEAISEGTDLVCFSGDKLFGGPQAGIIAGKKRFVEALKREPLFRALRCDKLVLAALQTTADLHLTDSETKLPARTLLRITKDELRARAAAMLVRLRGLPLQITVGRGSGNVGGGSLAQSVIPSVTLDIVPEVSSIRDFAANLRSFSPPIIAYIAGGAVKLDLRTIFPSQDDIVVDAIREASADTT
jgi:L-seryl-tRNA(Ser) seleniumtransferase